MTFKFRDGSVFKASLPEMIVEGLIIGDTIMKFTKGFTIQAEKENLKAEVTIYSDTSSTLGRIFSGIFGSSDKK